MLKTAVVKKKPSYLFAAEDLRDNPGQWQAYESKGHCVVLAGPGSGKTKTLTIKMARMLAEDIREPRGTACITYNNECSGELRRRLSDLGVRESRNIYIGTIHSFCLRNVVLPYARLAGVEISKEIAVASESEQTKYFQDAFASVISANASPESWRTGFDKYRRTHLDRTVPSWRGDDAEYAELIEKYEELLHKNGLVDFDDMVLLGLKLIEENEWVRDCLRARFPVLVVDEYQDLGPALHRIVLSLCFKSGMRLFAVGDPDQSIYGFAGAQPELLQKLADMPGVEKLHLRFNYRSGQRIIDASEFALGEERGYKAKGGYAGAILFRNCPKGIEEQAEVICTKIIPAVLKRKEGRGVGDLAVLYLDRNDGDVIESQVKAAGLKFIRMDKGAAYRKTPLIRWLEGCASWCTDASPSGGRQLSILLPQWDYFNASARSESASHKRRVELVGFLYSHRDPNQPLRDWLKEIEESCIGATLKREPTLRDEAAAYAHLMKLCGKEGALGGLTVSAFGGQVGSKEHLNLITLHSAKGLEFDAVMMIGMDEGRIPRYRASSEEKLASRRLFYVGLTRARYEVHLMYSGFVQNRFGRYDNGPSSFLVEVSNRLKESK
jgi:DNA helicase-2/ATP-dependent DNA helicase PcrA